MVSQVSRVYRLLLSSAMIILLVLVAVILLPAQANAQRTPDFSDFRSPFLSGERQASAVIDFKSVPKNRMHIDVVYSDSRDEVANGFDIYRRTGREPSGEARCTPLNPFNSQQNSKYRCNFIFPHLGGAENSWNPYE